jgi:hexulose-6-phosphate isomerase
MTNSLSKQKSQVGFMQGRLSPLIGGRIQAFPWKGWEQEFVEAEKMGFNLMEWTLDQEELHKNPLMTEAGQVQIMGLSRRHGLCVPSLTGDCFMQAPFWKVEGDRKKFLERDFLLIAKACVVLGISIIVMPLVDQGRLVNRRQEDVLVGFLEKQAEYLALNSLKVAFESDFTPVELTRFISRLNPQSFGVNYDIGNSASLGYDSKEEIEAYGNRIINVHIKDRPLGGNTVPLGEGHANIPAVFGALWAAGYRGNYILQTARAAEGDHAGVLDCYRKMALDWMNQYGA